MYCVWCLRKTEGAEWTRMTYAARDLQGCERLVELYEEGWGKFYYYKIERDGVPVVA